MRAKISEIYPACLFSWWRGLDLNQQPPSYRPHKGEFLVTELWLGESGYGAEMYHINEV